MCHVHCAMELLQRMMEWDRAGKFMSRQLACIAGLPTDEPSCLLPSRIYLDGSVVDQPLNHPLCLV